MRKNILKIPAHGWIRGVNCNLILGMAVYHLKRVANMNEEMTVSKAAELAGLTPGQVSSFIFAGFVTPEVHSPNGSGDHSVLSPKNIKELKLIGNLTKIGLKTATIGGVLELLAYSKMNWWDGGDSYVVVMKNDRWLITDNPFGEMTKMLFAEDGIIMVVKL